MKSLLILLLRGYKRFISPILPPACRFEREETRLLTVQASSSGVEKPPWSHPSWH